MPELDREISDPVADDHGGAEVESADTRRGLLLAGVLSALVVSLAVPPARSYALTLLALLALVTIHEAGHFFVARRLGATTPEFAVGFGPKVWSFSTRGTTWALRAIPLGGFVRIEGMETGGPEPTSDEPVASPTLSPWRQVAIAFAGPAANIAVAFVALFALFWLIGVPQPSTAVNALEGRPAAVAGMLEGDRIVAVGETPVASWEDTRAAIASAPLGQPITVTFDRAGMSKTAIITPQVVDGDRNVLGIEAQSVQVRSGPVGAFGDSISATGRLFTASVEGIAHLGKVFVSLPAQFLTPEKAPAENRVLSPVGAAQLASHAADEQGAGGVLALLATVSMFLAVFNLLPIPPFDGGHILLSGIEGVASTVRRKPVRIDRRRVIPVAVAATLAVAVLGITSIALDILRPITW